MEENNEDLEEVPFRGVKGDSKIAWINLVDVCKPKEFGGLSVCDLLLVNLSLLGKWRWFLLSGASGIWHDILIARYGVSLMTSILGRRAGNPRLASPWWRWVSFLGGTNVDSVVWFRDGFSLKVGYCLLTCFWEDTWVD